MRETFSKPSKPQTEQVNLELLLEQTVNLVTTSAREKNIDISSDFKTSEKTLKADPSQLKQVFLNIVMNAIQAMQDGGDLHISVDIKKSTGTISDSKDSFYIVFTDSGEGISAENLEHIFDPFFTTKNEGTGLGLSISYGIIQQHYGDIEIESREQQENSKEHGTRVSIMLPIMK